MNSIQLETNVEKDIEDDVKTFDSQSPRLCKNEDNTRKITIITLVINIITCITVLLTSGQVLRVLDQGMNKLDDISNNLHTNIDNSVHILQKTIEREIANITLSY